MSARARIPGWVVATLLWTAAVAAVLWVQFTRLRDPTYPGMPWQQPHQLADFRDTVWLPGRFLLGGGNPYDVTTYVPAHPWAQEFDLYAPAWLVPALALGALPFTAAAIVYLVLGALLATLFLWVTLRWAAPGLVRFGVPLGLLWFTLWSPSRYALQNGGTFVVFLGCVLVMLVIAAKVAGPEAIPVSRRLGAVGVALALVKPQFGLPLIVLAVAVGRWDVVWRGALLLGGVSLPVVVACSVAAGGFAPFLASVGSNLAYSGSADSPTGLASPFNGRTDLLGLAARLGAVHQPAWLAVVLPVVVVVIGVWLLRRARDVLTATTVAAVVTLLAVVHQPYDKVILVLPAVVVVAEALACRRERRRPRGPRVLLWAAVGLPVLHLRAGSLLLLPGLGLLGTDVVDTLAMLLALVLVAWLRRHPDPVAGPAAPHLPPGLGQVPRRSRTAHPGVHRQDGLGGDPLPERQEDGGGRRRDGQPGGTPGVRRHDGGRDQQDEGEDGGGGGAAKPTHHDQQGDVESEDAAAQPAEREDDQQPGRVGVARAVGEREQPAAGHGQRGDGQQGRRRAQGRHRAQ